MSNAGCRVMLQPAFFIRQIIKRNFALQGEYYNIMEMINIEF